MHSHKYRKLIPYIALVILLAISALTWQHFEKAATERKEHRYNEFVNIIEKDVIEQLDKNKMLLLGGAVLFQSSKNVTREEWHVYYQYLQVSTRYPRIHDLAFSRVVRSAELEWHIKEIKTEGFSDYMVWPEGERDFYIPIVFMEPFSEENRQHLGFDLFSEAVLRTAIDHTLDTGEVSMSGKITLLEETGEGIQSGFLIFVPVYTQGMPINSPEERRKANKGYVFGSYVMTDLMQGIFSDPMQNIDVNIYDGSEVSPEALMYYSNFFPEAPGKERKPLVTSQKNLEILGHQWTIVFETTPVFEAGADQYTPKVILVISLLFSLLLFFCLRSVMAFGNRAHSLVQKVTSRLRKSEDEYRLLTENTTDVIWTRDLDGNLTYISAAVEQLLGFTPKEIMSMPMNEYILWDDYKALLVRLVKETAKPSAERAHFIFEQACYKTKDSRLVDVEFNASLLRDGQGNVIGVQGSTRDITERKQSEDETRKQAKRAETLLQIASHLNTELELDKVKSIICEEACIALNMQMSAYLRYNNNTRLFYFDTYSGLPEEVTGALEPLHKKNVEILINKQKKTNLISDLSAVPELPFAQTLLSHGVIINAYSLVERDGLLLGLLLVGNDKKVDLLEDNIELLAGLANQAASAITNARLFSEAKNRLNQVQALRNIDLAITGSLDLRVTFQVVLDEVTNMLQTDAAAILRFDSQTSTLKYKHWRGFRSKDEDIDRIVIPSGKEGVGRMVKDRESVHIDDMRENEHSMRYLNLPADEGFVSYYAVPLIAKGIVLGVLEVFHREVHVSNDEWLGFLETLAGQAAIAIDNAELFSKLERSHVNLLNAYDATLEGWAHALELKDEESAEHSQRVTMLTLHIARKMGINEEELTHVRRGALLHDIGKMGIPDSILLKPGKLTDEEWEIMREHPVYAFEMFAPIDYLRQAVNIPYEHHEKWDGSGYPRKLKGKQIYLAARIFAVVDVYDALTSDRPYRKAWTKEKTVKYIKEQSGKHFDPQVVDVFLKEIDVTGV